MIPANKLLNEHLDNIAIALRPVKDFTPNDFPAVKRIEQAIRNKPLEELWYFDSTGMPVTRNQGGEKSVRSEFIDDREYPDNNTRRFYQDFDAPLAVKTHNHPSKYISPLSEADLINAGRTSIPIRATNLENIGGTVYEFRPGMLTAEDVTNIIKTPNGDFYYNNLPDVMKQLESASASRVSDWNFNAPDERRSIEDYKPQYNVYAMPTKVEEPTMAIDSFNIRRPAKRMASFIQQGDGTYQSYVDGKPHKLLTEAEALAAVDKLKDNQNWQAKWQYYQPDPNQIVF